MHVCIQTAVFALLLLLLLLLARPAGTMFRCMLFSVSVLALCTAALAASWPAGGPDFKEAAVLAANTQLKGSRYINGAAETHQLQESASSHIPSMCSI